MTINSDSVRLVTAGLTLHILVDFLLYVANLQLAISAKLPRFMG